MVVGCRRVQGHGGGRAVTLRPFPSGRSRTVDGCVLRFARTARIDGTDVEHRRTRSNSHDELRNALCCRPQLPHSGPIDIFRTDARDNENQYCYLGFSADPSLGTLSSGRCVRNPFHGITSFISRNGGGCGPIAISDMSEKIFFRKLLPQIK